MPDLAEQQRELTEHLRDPAANKPPAGIESRRIKIYNDLVYNNIEAFIKGGFPVTRSLYRDEDWHRLVRVFIRDYRCQSPYALEVSQEFVQFVMHHYEPSPADPPFLVELVHYEWVELALDIADEELPESTAAESTAAVSTAAVSTAAAPESPLDGVPVLSPLAWSLVYQYPVHTIGPGCEPDAPPPQPTYLVVYRNRDDAVQFMETNAATARLLELIRDNDGELTARDLLKQLAEEMNADSVRSIIEFGENMLNQFLQQDILLDCISH
ncbi:DUF2063 domain-containing protein [Halieaceae bacterium IMCC14734]|uniref:DUF2063 domain-containing protein n=1 Tax=Candidatus Litorirhabdus singularis TaxID=2518993 RepID=A0ABT3TIC8_9GAMM|nr:putative DNA-binding domain-containing protein [Candidatus Litorirhabdus singularis]MCX2982078.1 DUF2063 domain-containing protein [Candidatus Litorirhabdus singularis]